MKKQPLALIKNNLVHPVKTTIAAILAIFLARLLGLPEFYWAPISAIVVMESTLGATLTVSWRRLVGTALGSATGALLLTHFGPSLVAYGVGILGLGVICALLRLEKSAYRFAGVALTIIIFVAQSRPPWTIAIHRFIEISAGIVVSLCLTAVWPEKKDKVK